MKKTQSHLANPEANAPGRFRIFVLIACRMVIMAWLLMRTTSGVDAVELAAKPAPFSIGGNSAGNSVGFWLHSTPNLSTESLFNFGDFEFQCELQMNSARDGVCVILKKQDKIFAQSTLPFINMIPGWKHVLFHFDSRGIHYWLNGKAVPEDITESRILKSDWMPLTELERICEIQDWQAKSMTSQSGTFPFVRNITIFEGRPNQDNFEEFLFDDKMITGISGPFSSPPLHQLSQKKTAGLIQKLFPTMPASIGDLSGGLHLIQLNTTSPVPGIARLSILMEGMPLRHVSFELPGNPMIPVVAPNGTYDIHIQLDSYGALIEDLELNLSTQTVKDIELAPGYSVEIDVLSPFASDHTHWYAEVYRKNTSRIKGRFLSDPGKKFDISWIPDKNYIIQIHDVDSVKSLDISQFTGSDSEISESRLVSSIALDTFNRSAPLPIFEFGTTRIGQQLNKARPLSLQQFGQHLLIGSPSTGLLSLDLQQKLIFPVPSAKDLKIFCIHQHSDIQAFIGTDSGILQLHITDLGEIITESDKDFSLFSGTRINSILTDEFNTIWVGTDIGLYYRKHASEYWNEVLFGDKSSPARNLKNPSTGLMTGISDGLGPFIVRIPDNPTQIMNPVLMTDLMVSSPTSVDFLRNTHIINDFHYDPNSDKYWVAMHERLLEMDLIGAQKTILFESIEQIQSSPSDSSIIFSGPKRMVSYKNLAYHQIFESRDHDAFNKFSGNFTIINQDTLVVLCGNGLYTITSSPMHALHQIPDDCPTGSIQLISAGNNDEVYITCQESNSIYLFNGTMTVDITPLSNEFQNILNSGILEIHFLYEKQMLVVATKAGLLTYSTESSPNPWALPELALPENIPSLRHAQFMPDSSLVVQTSIHSWLHATIDSTGSSIDWAPISLPPFTGKITGMLRIQEANLEILATDRGFYYRPLGNQQNWISVTLKDRSNFSFGVHAILPQFDKKSRLVWVATTMGLYSMDVSSKLARSLLPAKIITAEITSMNLLANGSLVLWSKNSGVTLFNPSENIYLTGDHSHPLQLQDGITHYKSITTRQGNIWVTTNHGLYFSKIPNTPLPAPNITYILRDPSNHSNPHLNFYKQSRLKISDSDPGSLILRKPDASVPSEWKTKFKISPSTQWIEAPEFLQSSEIKNLLSNFKKFRSEFHFLRYDPYLNVSPTVAIETWLHQSLWSRPWMKTLVVALLIMSFAISGWSWNSSHQKKLALKEQRARSMTALRKTNLQLREAINNLEAAQTSKDRFLACMSHEIRTPMNGILGMTELMLESGLNSEQRDYGKAIQTCAQSLLTIINDILDISKIEAGKIELENVVFNLSQTIGETASLYKAVTRTKSLHLNMMLDKDLPAYVKGDPVRIKQVLNNFLNNAIKFTDLGFVELSARHLSSSADQTRIMLSVTDSGIGIPEDKLESIFESFSQVDASTTRKYGGTGLGLSICRKLAELMNGEIRVDSTLGSGSTFSLIVRFDMPKPEEIPSDQENPASGLIVDGPSKQLAMEIDEAQKLESIPEKRYSQEEDFDLIFDTPITPMGEQVLIVEDNRINQRLLLKFLSKLNLNAAVAHNGVEAVEYYGKHPFPIILMDCQMPVMDGYTATGEILKLAAQMGHQPVIIALTANAMPSDRQKCLNAGMHDYLPKPITLASLKSVLESNGLRIFQDA